MAKFQQALVATLDSRSEGIAGKRYTCKALRGTLALWPILSSLLPQHTTLAVGTLQASQFARMWDKVHV
jgi:hypothetical protein